MTMLDFFSNFLRFLSTLFSHEHVFCADFPHGDVGIDGYIDHIQVRCQLDGIKRMEAFDVVKVSLYRSAVWQSEYVSATVKGLNGRKFHLAFERFGAEVIDENADSDASAQAQTPSPMEGEPGSSNLSIPLVTPLPQTDATASIDSESPGVASLNSGLLSRRRASVKVTPLHYECQSVRDELYRTLVFSKHPAKPLPLSHLAILAQTMRNMNPEYLHPSENYFYAKALVDVIEIQYEGIVMKKSEEVGQASGRKGEAGMWNMAVSMDNLVDRFKEDMENFKAPIHRYEDERNGNIARLKRRMEEAEAETARLMKIKLALEAEVETENLKRQRVQMAKPQVSAQSTDQRQTCVVRTISDGVTAAELSKPQGVSAVVMEDSK
ncbi:hypothetical protein BD410DRAFT_901432 [Rickenella mellea]|uniref:Uncharacterized protein n=1 Tax=Rickenella mellea TaxID=50990 RepID=A0A4Y7PQ03_9AGAM|nr:hypothetical protein BD410DRAFT_901432 [Rickenella mellea]